MARTLKSLPVPRAFCDTELRDYKPRTKVEQAALGTVTAWVEGFDTNLGRGILLAGQPGLGKTMLASAAIHALPSSVRAAFVHTFEYERWLRNRMTLTGVMNAAKGAQHQALTAALDDWEHEDKMLRFTRRVPVLVLDDLGKEYGKSQWLPLELHALLRGRYYDGKPTIITTNHAPQDFTDAYGGAMESFIWEAYEVVVLAGPDHRK